MKWLEVYLGQLEAHLGWLEANLGQLEAHLGQLEAHLGQLEAHLGQLEAHLGWLLAHFVHYKATLCFLEHWKAHQGHQILSTIWVYGCQFEASGG